MNIILMIVYVVSAVVGSTLIKMGSGVARTLFTVPVVNVAVSLVSILGIIAYSLSFVAYIVLLTKMELSFISPLLIGFVYVLLMITAFTIFKEPLTIYKLIGCGLILVGVVFILNNK